jgi:hypothetical protein
MFPKGFRAREAAAKARSKQRIVSTEVRDARAAILDKRDAEAAGFTYTPNTDVLAGRVSKPADTPGLTLTVDGKLPKAFSTAIRPDGAAVIKVDGTAPDVAPKQNDNLVSLPPVNEDETGDQIASQIAALTEGAPVPQTVTHEAPRHPPKLPSIPARSSTARRLVRPRTRSISTTRLCLRVATPKRRKLPTPRLPRLRSPTPAAARLRSKP